MALLLQSVLALVLLGAAVYVQKQVPAFTKRGAKVAVTRTLLVLVGIGFGLTGAAYVTGQPQQMLAFLIGFGVVHMPAAFILFIKGRRGEGKS